MCFLCAFVPWWQIVFSSKVQVHGRSFLVVLKFHDFEVRPSRPETNLPFSVFGPSELTVHDACPCMQPNQLGDDLPEEDIPQKMHLFVTEFGIRTLPSPFYHACTGFGAFVKEGKEEN